MEAPFADRRGQVLAQVDEATRRIRARLDEASDAEARALPADGAWTPAQIVSHVAAFNRLLAGVLTGQVASASPASASFVARPWNEIVAQLGGRFEAPRWLQPPPEVSRAEALAALDTAAGEVRAALEHLSEDRAAMIMTHSRVGTITLAQVGDWIVAHTIRHNAQLKRVLGR